MEETAGPSATLRSGRDDKGEGWRFYEKLAGVGGVAKGGRFRVARHFLDGGEAAHFAVFEGEMLATPGYCVSGKAPDPDAQGYYVAGGQEP